MRDPVLKGRARDAEIERLRLAGRAGGEAYAAGLPCEPPDGDASYRRCWIGGWCFAERQARGDTPMTRRFADAE